MMRMFLIVLPTLFIACGALEDLRSPTGPQEQEEIKPLLPEEARQQLAELEIPYNQKAFIEKAEAGDLTAVRLFVWAGMDVNVQPYTASGVYVALRDDPRRFSHLKYSWFPQEGQQDNDTALMKAAIGGHLEVVQLLCENGADLRLKNQQKQSAIYFAAAGGHLDIVEYLVDFAAPGQGLGLGDYPFMTYDPMMHGPVTPIMWAAYGGHLDVVQYIHAYMKYNGVPGGWAGIYWASIGGHVNVIDWLLEDPNARSKGILGKCLMLAAWHNQPVVVGRLLAADADLHFRTGEWIGLDTPDGVLYFRDVGFGPLHAAIQAGHSDILRTLLEHWMNKFGADGRDGYGMTALMFAAAGGDTEIARILIDNGAPVNGASDIGISALMFAAEWGHVDMVEMLLEEGADQSLVSAYDDTALTLAEGNGHSDVVAMLQ